MEIRSNAFIDVIGDVCDPDRHIVGRLVCIANRSNCISRDLNVESQGYYDTHTPERHESLRRRNRDRALFVRAGGNRSRCRTGLRKDMKTQLTTGATATDWPVDIDTVPELCIPVSIYGISETKMGRFDRGETRKK